MKAILVLDGLPDDINLDKAVADITLYPSSELSNNYSNRIGRYFGVKVIPLPKNTTNGDMIKTMFPNAEIKEIRGSFDKDKLLGYRIWLDGRSQDYFLDWWNATYKVENEE